jgi:hypothetical protein
MALSNENNKITYTPSTSTTEFDFPYPYFDSTDLVVTIQDSAGVITTLTIITEYTVVATNGDPASGATITTASSYTSGDTVTISREVPYTQEYNLQDGATIDPTALNKAFDRTVAQSQQIVEQQARQVVHPITDPSGLTYETPSVAGRASKALGYDASGNVVALDLADSGTISGNASAGIDLTSNIISAKVDDTTIEFSTGDIAVKAGGIGDTQISDVATSKLSGTILEAQIGAGEVTLTKIDADASLTARGVIEQATDAEVITGTDSDRAVSASNIEALFGSSGRKVHSTNGYQKLPSGLILQWGLDTSVTGNVSGSNPIGATFPIAFPTACLSVQLTLEDSNSTASCFVDLKTKSTTAYTGAIKEANSATQVVVGVNWFAIGY